MRNCGKLSPGRAISVFQAKKEYALFLEDDLVLGENYLNVTHDLINLALANNKIGYVSAYGNLFAALDEQEAASGQLIQMHENWGAAFTRSSWEAQKAIREQYWDLVRDRDYRSRDNDAVRRLYAQYGYKCDVSSQDASRWVATLHSGMVRLTTATCHAKYIGAVGEHSNEEWHVRHKFDDSQLFPERPKIQMPSEHQIELWLKKDREKFILGYEHSYVTNSRIDDLTDRNGALEKCVHDLTQQIAELEANVRALSAEISDLSRSLGDSEKHRKWLADVHITLSYCPIWWRFLPTPARRQREFRLLKERRLFDAAGYLQSYGDVAALGVDPLEYYIRHGIDDGHTCTI